MMALLRMLRYYFHTMRHLPFSPLACGACGSTHTQPILRYDRYLLPVEVAACVPCGLVYTTRNITGHALQHFYREQYRGYYENRAVITPSYLAQHRDAPIAEARLAEIHAVLPTIASILEIGCGLGFFLAACKREGARVVGLEPGDLFRRYAQETLGLGDAVIGASYETLTTLPFAPQLVTLFHVFEHLEHPAACLRWIAQHIAAEGVLVIEVPDITGDWRRMGVAQFHLAHRWYFSPVTLCNLLAANGFTPFYLTRSDVDGIYPGNLRVFARLGEPAAAYPLPAPPAAETARAVRHLLHPLSLKNGYPRMALRLVRQAWRAANWHQPPRIRG